MSGQQNKVGDLSFVEAAGKTPIIYKRIKADCTNENIKTTICTTINLSSGLEASTSTTREGQPPRVLSLEFGIVHKHMACCGCDDGIVRVISTVVRAFVPVKTVSMLGRRLFAQLTRSANAHDNHNLLQETHRHA